MNTLTRTITVLIALSVLTPGIALAQNVSTTEAGDADTAGELRDDKIRDDRLGRAGLASALARSMRVVPEEYSFLSRSRWPSRSGGGASVLVIPSAEIETRDLLTINEDINVMSRIFATNLQRAHILPSVGNLFGDDNVSSLMFALSGRSKNSIQSLYLQGYAVLFLMKVDFPLSPSRQVQQQDATEKEEEGDKVWKDTRRQLYEPDRVAKRKRDDSAVKYDAEKIENLKTTLTKALKHAANIRGLKSDESIILTVTGSGVSSDVKSIRAIPGTDQLVVIDGKNTTRVYKGGLPREIAISAPTVLTIRVKKSDIDGFAKGDLDLEQFRQRVQMISYPVLAGETSRRSALDMMYEESAGTLY